jgi:hypothetical protein
MVLARRVDRCGASVHLGTVAAAWREVVPVPAPSASNMLVYVRITGASPTGLEWLRGALFRGNPRSITFDGGRTHRLIDATVPDGLPLRAGIGVDYPSPFERVPQARTISLDRANLGAPAGRPLRLAFYAQAIMPWR